MINGLKSINLAVAFFLELAMLGSFGYWGFHTGKTTILKVALGIGVPLLAVVIWGIFMAPNSSTRLEGAAYYAVYFSLFILAAGALFLAGQPTLGIVFSILVAIHTILASVWHQ